MNKEHVQWAVIGVLVVAIAAVGTLVKMQNEQFGVKLQELTQAIDTTNRKIENAIVRYDGKLILEEPSISAPNRFSFNTNKVGDIIAGLRIVAIEPIPGIAAPFGSDNYQVRFSGQKTFDASYSYQNDEFFAGPSAVISSMNAGDLPMNAGELGDNSFAVTNLDKFRQLISKEYGSGQAKVTMENFVLVHAPAEVRNEADLVRVISKSK